MVLLLTVHHAASLVFTFSVFVSSLAAVSVDSFNEQDLPEIFLKGGRCPAKIVEKSLCPIDIHDQCQYDNDCSGIAKCCFTGCAKVCVLPLNSGCELVHENAIRRGRAIGLKDPSVAAPICEPDGSFSPVQCLGGMCFCVDTFTGFEIAGTRAPSFHEVNCSNPDPCSGYQCRMLCPFDFNLDEKGCPMCQCRDPCSNITCPEKTSCMIEEFPCSNEPCPPLPTCKEARSLSSFCPIGDPLLIDASSQRPFLCGNELGKPICPPLYKCIVGRGHEYGVCCPAVEELFKPGTCPLEGHNKNVVENWEEGNLVDGEARCGASCEHDLQCPSTQKCCISEVCGQHCVQPANLTACLQQKMIAELMIMSEKEGRGYIPQCNEDTGLYKPKQCSRNGMVCWCTDQQGYKFPRSLGASHEVHCQNITGTERSLVCPEEPECSTVCEFGYVVDNAGCTTCACEDPCQQLECPHGSECVMRDDPSTCASPADCVAIPMCVINSSIQIPDEAEILSSIGTHPALVASECPQGKEPLFSGDAYVNCGQNNPCPPGSFCTPSSTGVNFVCCPATNQIDDTNEGHCPFIQNPDESLCSEANHCFTDSDCTHEKKCCVITNCAVPVCVEAILPQNYSSNRDIILHGPTMCEYLRDLVQLEGVSLALPTPTCDSNGAYEPIQCNALGQCWCVDDFGTPIPNTKASSRELLTCDGVRMALSCSDLVCRIGCDYGFVLDPDTACPICECRDPCQNIDCGLLHECQMVDVPCIDGICPPIPQCVPSDRKEDSVRSCSNGPPYMVEPTNVTLSCNPAARALECPTGFTCEGGANSIDGICCPTLEKSEKAGQCPFVMLSKSATCDLECSEDAHCLDEEKCCSNGCGTHCIEPIILTACQHQRVLLEHHARENGISSGKAFLPQCDEGGNFVPTQCHPGTLTCWCVDSRGLELSGTRVSSPAEPNCQEPLVCPAMNCNLACVHGYQLDNSGCPVCSCRDPCEEVTCTSSSEECRMVQVACLDGPCPPLPVCLPKLENPCPSGTPLSINGSLAECGPKGQSCPSSHKCHLSPLGEYALCCPKPREVCFHERDSGECEGSIQKWYFDPDSNRCERFRYGGCGGNLNNFESKEECEQACPKLTTCQKSRQKNLKNSQKLDKPTFLPKCDKETGAWMPEQCLEELGVCWCVTSDGNQVRGSLTRGSPSCFTSSRTARLMKFNSDPSQPTNMICAPGEIVHVCEKNLCSNKVCLSHPDAVCRVNPCGGCAIQFVDSFNAPVDCQMGLTECQKDLQSVLNSDAFARPNRIISDKVVASSSMMFANENGNYKTILKDSDLFYPNEEEIMKPWEAVFNSLGTPGKDARYLKKRGQGSSALGTHPVDLTTPVLYDHGNEPYLDDPNDILEGQLEYQTGRPPVLSTKPERPVEFTGSIIVTVGMTLQPPQCLSDGSWVREQRSGDLTWCVDANGIPIHGTLTRGHVRCGPNGQILEQISVGPVCPRGVQPMVCTNECLGASCSSHPEAVCTADPCNQCQVSFYLPMGELVNCEERCSQPLSAGMCRASFKRYFFNSTAKQCQPFIYGGCRGNDNNFVTIEECQSSCTESVKTCELPVKVGHCSAKEEKWFYNKQSRRCEPFLYSGCGGNENNFKSKISCEARCPDLVLCPFWSANSMEPEQCSRSLACSNQTCYGYPDTICEVDPCECKTKFVNLDGEEISCMMPTEEPRTRMAFTYEEQSAFSDELTPPNSLSDGKLSPVTIFLEGEPSLTRCQLLQRHLRQSGDSRNYIAQCDADGRFLPTQCYSSRMDVFILEMDNNDTSNGLETPDRVPKCWCVDEIGRKIEPPVYFTKGAQKCDIVPVESVIVTLGFRGSEAGINKVEEEMKEEIKKQVGMLLNQLSAQILENRVKIIDLPEITQVKFTLLGENKIDVAYQLEDQVRRGSLALRLNEYSLPADLRSSWFHHQVSDPLWAAESSRYPVAINLQERVEPREVVSQVVTFEPPYLAAIVVLTVLSAILICGLIMGVVLYRRHITGRYPKQAPRGSMQSLAFSDSTLDIQSIESRLSTPNSVNRSQQLKHHHGNHHHSNVSTIEDEYQSSLP